MKISIIIPVYNAEKYLSDLFNALSKNRFKKGDEIILVDNGSTDKSLKLCKKFEIQNPDLIKVLEYKEKPGSYAARNFAAKQAGGDILLFTDADTKPVEHWVTVVRNNIVRGEVLAGKISLEIVENSLWEHFDTIAHLNSEKNAANKCVATANMSVMREDFFKVGLFEERFSGGDYEWSNRAARCGLTIVFNPEAMVYHPTRKTFEQILTKEQRIAYGAGNHYKISGKKLITLKVRYLLKIFKFDTNIRYTIKLKKRGVGVRGLLLFNKCFMKIRLEQYKKAVSGYKMLDVRKMNLK